MRNYCGWMVALLVFGFLTTAAPKQADAALRLGVDGLWMPLAFQNIEGDNTEIDTNHELASFGVAAHASLGFDIFSLGLKVNYFNQSISFAEGGGDTRLTELDINLLGRIGIPATGLAVFAEAGPTTNPDFDYIGYNVGGGLEYDILGMPLLGLNVGAMGQYVNVSEFEMSYGDESNKRDASLSEGRLMFFVGIDFSI